MWCPKCGNQVPDNGKFCPKCGFNLQEEPKTDPRPKTDPKQGTEHELKKGPDFRTEEPEKKGRTVLYIIISVIVLALATAGGFAFYHFVLNGDKKASSKKEISFDMDSEDESETEEEETERKKSRADKEDAEKMAETEKQTTGTTAAATVPAAIEPTQAAAPAVTAHTYKLIVKDCTWTEAYQEAKSMGGYLVNINTAEEYEIIKNLITTSGLQSMKFWVGGMRTPGTYEYHWVDQSGVLDAEVLNSGDYAFQWMVNEPSFKDGSTEETYMNIFYYKKEQRWVWNDVPDNMIAVVPSYSGTVGYICELDN